MILLLQLLIMSYFVSQQVIFNLCSIIVCAWLLFKLDLGSLRQSLLLQVYFAFNHWRMAIECTMNTKISYHHLPKFELTIINQIKQINLTKIQKHNVAIKLILA